MGLEGTGGGTITLHAGTGQRTSLQCVHQKTQLGTLQSPLHHTTRTGSTHPGQCITAEQAVGGEGNSVVQVGGHHHGVGQQVRQEQQPVQGVHEQVTGGDRNRVRQEHQPEIRDSGQEQGHDALGIDPHGQPPLLEQGDGGDRNRVRQEHRPELGESGQEQGHDALGVDPHGQPPLLEQGDGGDRNRGVLSLNWMREKAAAKELLDKAVAKELLEKREKEKSLKKSRKRSLKLTKSNSLIGTEGVPSLKNRKRKLEEQDDRDNGAGQARKG